MRRHRLTFFVIDIAWEIHYVRHGRVYYDIEMDFNRQDAVPCVVKVNESKSDNWQRSILQSWRPNKEHEH